MKVGLFIPCYINAIYPQVGVASYKLLKKGWMLIILLTRPVADSPWRTPVFKMNL